MSKSEFNLKSTVCQVQISGQTRHQWNPLLKFYSTVPLLAKFHFHGNSFIVAYYYLFAQQKKVSDNFVIHPLDLGLKPLRSKYTIN